MSESPMPAATMSAATMSSPALNGLARFTVEQIELVRRLRNSGLTKDQLVQAFDAMDRLDRELGPVYSLPVTLVCIWNHKDYLLMCALHVGAAHC